MAEINRGIWVNQNGTWKQVSIPSINDNGTWKSVRAGYVKQNGVWKAFYPSAGSQSYYSGTNNFTVPPGIYQLTFSGAAGGGGGGTLMDGGYNDDNGSSGGGSSGQMVTNYSIPVQPGDNVIIRIGTGGGPGAFVRDGNDVGGNGTETSISTPTGTYILYGGRGGGGGSPAGGGNFPGGQYPRGNPTISTIFGYDGNDRNGNMNGGAGYDGYVAPGVHDSNGNNGRLGGGGSGLYSGYLREDRGRPGWRGGYGGSGFLSIMYGPGLDPNYSG